MPSKKSSASSNKLNAASTPCADVCATLPESPLRLSLNLAMPAYVILDHDHPHQHWDFMLEQGDMLATWRLAAPPQSGQTIAAEPSFAHRRAYLDYEGPVSGDRGRVVQWDRGEYELLAQAPEHWEIRVD